MYVKASRTFPEGAFTFFSILIFLKLETLRKKNSYWSQVDEHIFFFNQEKSSPISSTWFILQTIDFGIFGVDLYVPAQSQSVVHIELPNFGFQRWKFPKSSG